MFYKCSTVLIHIIREKSISSEKSQFAQWYQTFFLDSTLSIEDLANVDLHIIDFLNKSSYDMKFPYVSIRTLVAKIIHRLSIISNLKKCTIWTAAYPLLHAASGALHAILHAVVVARDYWCVNISSISNNISVCAKLNLWSREVFCTKK